MTKEFSTLAVLSVTTGRLLTRPKDESEGNGIGQLYELLGWMTDDSPFTHQLGRFSDECKPWIYRWHPQLEAVEREVIERCENQLESVIDIQDDMLLRFGETIELQKIPRDDHETKNLIEELISMRGTDKGIVVVEVPNE